jgi:hypothetical protein
MERILIFLKHHSPFVWRIIEFLNSIVFDLVYWSKIEKTLPVVFEEFIKPPFSYRRLNPDDSGPLFDLVRSQKSSDLEYFRPHCFDPNSIRQQFRNSSFLMMGSYDGAKMTGYFFLRFFVNRKCFVGRLIDESYRGMGIGNVMNNIMYETAWRTGFRCLSTISKKNERVMRAHSKNKSMVVIKELQNDYLLVEFIRNN